ncbi:MAG TPA: T9SS type A sorting domain-containing protein, partial [Ferruginibacter sp.]|nr:T9SS type A sorting domain-containing protein [Ferruginibacter sp.]
TYTGPTLAIDNRNHNPRVVKNLMKVYPNPVTNMLMVQAKKDMRKPLRAQVYDINGRLVAEKTSYLNNFGVDVSAIPAGIYTFKLYNMFDVEMQVEKIIKQ